MTNKTVTKRTLTTGVLAVLACIAMLIGTTFAWFTDTASTAVNKIVAGNLDVDIVDANDQSLNGKQLSFRNAEKSADILWEPGATFELDAFKIVNKGKLAFKYKVVISSAIGDVKLLDAIDFTVKFDNKEVPLADWDGILLPDGKTATPGTDEQVKETSLFTISGKMRTDAGNEYQGLSLDGLGITVYATQYNYESDSFNNEYDKDADMTPDNLDQMGSANVTKTVDPEKETWFSQSAQSRLYAPVGSLPAGDYTLRITPLSGGKVAVDADSASYAYDVKLLDKDGNPVTAADGTTFRVWLEIGSELSNVKVYHDGALIESNYSSAAGAVDFYTTSFSTFDVTFDAPVAIVGGKTYPNLSAAIYGAKSGDTITVLRDFASDGATMNKADMKLTIDLNGHTITFNKDKSIRVYMGELTLTGTGVMQENTPNYAPIIVMHKDNAPAVVTVGKDVTLKGWSGIMINPKNAYSNTNRYAPVINVNGTLIGQTDTNGGVGAGLYVNGKNVTTSPAITVNIYETAVLTGTGAGIYGAGYAVYNTCGTITGDLTGVELRAGKLNVTGGTVTGNGIPTTVESNGNGATTVGAGIAVAQHTTKLPTELTVTGGVINGYTALHQSNPQKNDDAAVANVKLSVSGGTFNAINGGVNAVYSENCTGFITDGTFSSAVAAKYMAN